MGLLGISVPAIGAPGFEYASLYRACKTVLESALQTYFLEESMSRFVRFPRRALACGALLAVAFFLVGVAGWAWPPSAKPRQAAAKSNDDASLLEGFRHAEDASDSDTMKQISGSKMTMS